MAHWLEVDVERIVLDARAGRVSEELARRGIPAETRVRVLVEIVGADELRLAEMAQEGGAFAFLADEPELYTDADAVERAG